MADLLDKHVVAILRLLDEADDIVSALYRQGANKDYKCKSLREKLRAIEKELTEDAGRPEVRLIDANALYRKVKTECNPYGKPTIGFDDGKKVLEFIDEAQIIEAAPKWIPCSERLPKIFEDVLIVYLGFDGEKHITKAYMDDEENAFDWCSSWNGDVIDAEVTHWMPVSLLAPPDEK